MSDSPRSPGLRAEELAILALCIAGVLVAGLVQHIVVLGVSPSPLRLLMPLIVGATFGTLLIAVRRVRARERKARELVEQQAAQIRALNERLSDAVRSQGRELKSAGDMLVESNRLNGAGLLASGVAHDFNNLLTIVLSGASFLQEHVKGAEDAEVVESLLSAGERGANLTRQLLAFARPWKASREVRCLNRTTDELTPLLRRVLGREVEVRVSLAQGELPVSAGRGPIEQVLLNLAMNARDAMPGRGSFSITTSRDGAEAILEVSDSGVGMSPEVQARIFETFFSTKGEGRGSGIGLAVVQSIVQHAGGSIGVQSALGSGTTFRLRFPLAQESAPVQSTPSGGVVSLSSGVVVLADDDAQVRAAASTVLARLGLSGRAVAGQREAVEALQSIDPDQVRALVTDLLLADGDGLSLAVQVRATHPRLPIVLTSASDASLTDSAIVGLAKPYGFAQLQEALSRAAKLVAPR
ncbi:MAG: response regulator [Myxococcaceae bacterium]|nr:response regulator [Myxococcaceae bacterium]